MDHLVSTAWLAENLSRVVVCDATKYLPTDNKDGRAEYARARIPGARFFDIDRVADPDATLPHMAPTPARFEKAMAELGIGNADAVVFYDQKGLYSAARGWWLLRLMGHRDVAVLDGGLPKWLAEGRPTEAGDAPAPPAAAPYVADYVGARLRGIGDVKAALRDNTALVLDARSRARFDGTAPEPRPGLPSGHMPGAASLPFTDLLAPDGTMLPPDALRARFAAAGADGARPLIASCGTGVTACVVALGAVIAGLPEPAVYDGSWTEWAARPETKKVTS